ncbi:MAG: hypothetical protein MUQ10_13415, partial [Anaerolineae bacterium]|nr:hypothetical protein [Anaerolineae bacterium]
WRVADYGGVKDAWYSDWFEPTLERIEIGVLGWESLIDIIAAHDPLSAGAMHEFYQGCLQFNQPAP